MSISFFLMESGVILSRHIFVKAKDIYTFVHSLILLFKQLYNFVLNNTKDIWSAPTYYCVVVCFILIGQRVLINIM